MLRFYFILTTLGGVLLSFAVFAKNLPQENLYIPDGAFDTQERLPPIRLGAYGNTSTVKRASPNTLNSHSSDASSSSASQSLQNNLHSPSSALKKLNNHEKPDYKEKYDDYLNDLKIIGETGKIPDNPELNADLKNMNSDEKFEIE